MTSSNGTNGHKPGAFDTRHKSRHILDGVERAGARSMLKGIGLTDEEFRAAISEVMQAHDDAVAAAERAQSED